MWARAPTLAPAQHERDARAFIYPRSCLVQLNSEFSFYGLTFYLRLL